MSPVWRIHTQGLHAAELVPPLSKSDAQRALVLGHILGVPELGTLDHEPEQFLAADVRVLRRGLRQLAQPPTSSPIEIDCADGGAPFRLLLTQAALTPGLTVSFRGTQRLGERPHDALIHSLRATLGESVIAFPNIGTGFWPLRVQGLGVKFAREPCFRIEASQSSQYVSSLLLGAARLQREEGRPWQVQLDGPVASEGYLELTLEWVQRCGFVLDRSSNRFTVRGWAAPSSWPRTPGDWSSLGYLLAIAWKTGSRVKRVDANQIHPDAAIVERLREAGLRVSISGDEAMVEGQATNGIQGDAEKYPDLIPTLAAIACVLPKRSSFFGVGILKAKESDRLAGVEALVRAAGGTTLREGDDILHVNPPSQLPKQLHMSSAEDHRMAMASATLAVLCNATLELESPECVTKSFPSFWEELRKTGIRQESI